MMKKFIKILVFIILFIVLRSVVISWLDNFLPNFIFSEYINKFKNIVNNIISLYKNTVSGNFSQYKSTTSSITPVPSPTIPSPTNPENFITNHSSFNKFYSGVIGGIVLFASFLWKFYKGKIMLQLCKQAYQKNNQFWENFQREMIELDKKLQDSKKEILELKEKINQPLPSIEGENLDLSEPINNFKSLLNETILTEFNAYTKLVLDSLKVTGQVLDANNFDVENPDLQNPNLDEDFQQHLNKINFISDNTIAKIQDIKDKLSESSRTNYICTRFIENADSALNVFIKHNSPDPNAQIKNLVSVKKLLQNPECLKKIQESTDNLLKLLTEI